MSVCVCVSKEFELIQIRFSIVFIRVSSNKQENSIKNIRTQTFCSLRLISHICEFYKKIKLNKSLLCIYYFNLEKMRKAHKLLKRNIFEKEIVIIK